MLRSHRRAAEARDLAAETEGKGSLVRNLLAVTLPGGVVLFLGVLLLFRSLLAALVPATLFVLASTWSNVCFFRSVRERSTTRSARSEVEVLEVEATRVLDLEHLGSHGPAYCFFTADGEALLLVGQWMLDVPNFPSLSFRLIRWADDGRPIRIEVLGGEVEPEPSTVALQGRYANGDVETLHARPETLQQDLDRAFGKAA